MKDYLEVHREGGNANQKETSYEVWTRNRETHKVEEIKSFPSLYDALHYALDIGYRLSEVQLNF